MRDLWRELAPFVRLLHPYRFRMTVGTILGMTAVAAAVGLLSLAGWFLTAAALAGSTLTGAGAFNLVRRKAFDHAHGFETMKLTVTDDVVFGRILKQTGARAGVLNGRDHVNVYFYRTLHDMACGSERALFTMFANFSAARLILIGTLMLFLELAPFIALLFFALPVLQMIGAGLTLTALVVSLVVNIYLGRPWWTSFFVPVAIMIMYICMVRAAILGKKRGGIYWRGTFYSSEQLRKGRQI